MFRLATTASVFALVLIAQASALEPIANQPCMVRYCAESQWMAYNDGEKTYRVEECTRWASRVNSKCWTQQQSNGIQLPPPRSTVPGGMVIR